MVDRDHNVTQSTFDRCMAAKQKLTKGRLRARQKKMQQIAKLLDMNISSAALTPGLPRPLLCPSGTPGGHRLLSRSGSTSSESGHLAGTAGSRIPGGRASNQAGGHLATEYAFYEAQRTFGYARHRPVHERPSQRAVDSTKKLPTDERSARPRSLLNKIA